MSIQMPSAPNLPSMLESYIRWKKKDVLPLNTKGIPPLGLQRTGLRSMMVAHQLYLQHISRAHQQYLQLNSNGSQGAESGRQRVRTTFVLRGDDFYAGYVWFPSLIQRATDTFLELLRTREPNAKADDQWAWQIIRCALVVLAPMPRLPGNGELQFTLEASMRPRQEGINFDLNIEIGDKRLVQVTEGVAQRFSGTALSHLSTLAPKSNSKERKSPNVSLSYPENGRSSNDPSIQCQLMQRQLSLNSDDLQLWHAGRLDLIFGPTYADVAAHVRTPSVPVGPNRWQRVDIYLSAGRRVEVTGVQFLKEPAPLEVGHVLDQAFYLAMMGLSYSGMTMKRDGWRVEPLPGHMMKLELVGDATRVCGPGVSVVSHLKHISMSKGLDREDHDREGPAGEKLPPVFIAQAASEVADTPLMQIHDFGVTLVPDFPIFDASINPQGVVGVPDERALIVEGMRYDAQAMLHCSWGKPSAGFGPQFQKFDTSGRVSRLPGPPYQFITRICDISAKTGELRSGVALTVEYDVPSSAWYFDENAGVMPHAVLMEAVLQPCGWLSVYLGIPMQTDEPLYVRNLDGTGTQYSDVTPDSGVLRTTVTLKNVSRANHTFLHTYAIESTINDTIVYRGETTFGHFPEESLRNQVGLASDHILPDYKDPDARVTVDRAARELEAEPARKLHLIDRIVQYDPVGGIAGQGRVIAEKSVTPDAWFFKAHFFQDPVQPGSLGIEAMLHALKWVMKEKDLDRSFTRPRFEAIRTSHSMSWKYRGHVVPTNRLIRIVVDLLEQGEDDSGTYVVADAMLVVDDVPIYRANSIGMRIVEMTPQSDRASSDTPLDISPGPSNRQGYWARETGIEEWIVFDIYEALFQRFVGEINIMNPTALKSLEKTPAFYLANHQTAVESPIFNYVLSAVQQIPLVGLAKDEHRMSWIGKLMDLAARYPGVRLMQPMQFIERDNHGSALDVLKDLGRSMQRERFSTLIHVEGTRSTHAGRPVETISSTIIDSVVNLNIPIIPVRFTGGLPIDDGGIRYDFPYRFGKQDYWIGTPIHAAQLAKRSIIERKSVVLEAINQLGPPAENEKPSTPGDSHFIEQVNHWQTHYGVAPPWAVILKCLEEHAEKSEQTVRFLEFVRGEKSSLSPWDETWFSQLFEIMKGSDHARRTG